MRWCGLHRSDQPASLLFPLWVPNTESEQRKYEGEEYRDGQIKDKYILPFTFRVVEYCKLLEMHGNASGFLPSLPSPRV